MKTKRFFGVCLTLCMIITMLSAGMPTAFAADDLTVTIDTGASVTLQDGDSDGYYDIGTADELYAFAAAVNSGNTAINGELTANITVNENVLDENGNLNGDGSNFRVWTPIGNDSIRYTGIFDGGEYTVSGLYFNNNTVKYVGLFGYVGESGKVQNAGVEDSYFVGGEFYVGGVVGQNIGTVTNCYNAGAVNGNKYLGGVVGHNGGTVASCHNAGTVNGSQWMGGVVGYNKGTIADCHNTGKIDGNSNVGGIAGYNTGTITNCYNTAAVYVSRMYGGGVVGNNKGTVTNCYNAGTLNGSAELGGVAGYNTGTITNCYNINTVWSKSMSTYVGGIVSQNTGTVTNCYNTGEISGYFFKNGSVAGENSGSGTITNCYYLAGSADSEIGSNTASNESIISEVTEAQVKAASGEEGALVDMLNEWVAAQNDVKYKGWHFCSNFSADYPSLNLAYTYSDNGANHIAKCTLCGSETTETHTYFYTANDGAINENCELCDHSASINPVLPENPVYDGNAHEVSYTGSFANPDATVLIQYLRYNEDSETGYEALDSAPADAGSYIVRLSVGEIYVEGSMNVIPKAIELIGVEVNYKDYDGTPYVEIDPYYGYGGFKADGVMNYDSIEILCNSAELESANAGTYDKVTVKGLTITGEDAHNYTVVSEATIPVYNIWGNYESSVTVYEKNLSIKPFDQEAGSLDAIDQSQWEIDEYYGLLEGHRIESVKLVAEMNGGSTKYGSISVEKGSVRIVDADGNDVTANYGISTNSATLTLTCPDHDEFDEGFCKNCGGYEKATYNENEGYYEIENAGQLFWFAEYIANVTNEANAKLTDNITIPEGKMWTPIYNLYGTIDGNYKTISGLNVSESDSDYVGFLGYIGYWANVCNLHITNSNFVDADATYVGAIVGYHGGGEITNCYTDENVNVETGGVCGALVGYTSYTTMKNCYAHDVLAGNGHYGTFENCYYIGEDDEIDGTTAVTAEQLASGEVAYLLQSGILGEPIYDDEWNEIGTTELELVWGQNIGIETYPVFGGKKVYLSNGIYHNEVKEFKILLNGTNGSKATATVAIPTAGTYTLIFADYEETRLNNIDTVTVTAESDKTVIIVPSEIDITFGTDDKIMLWKDMTDLVPLCEAYIVK